MGKKYKQKTASHNNIGTKFNYTTLPLIITVTGVLASIAYQKLYPSDDSVKNKNLITNKKLENIVPGECSKAKNLYIKIMDKALDAHGAIENTYYSTMGKIIDKLYASTRIGFECRDFVMWDIKKIYKEFTSDEVQTIETFKYRSATSASHQAEKIKSGLQNGKIMHDDLTYSDLDTYAKKMADSSKDNHPAIDAKIKQVNGIWLTNKNSPKEMHKDDIRSLVKQKNFFKDDGEWSHVVWTNDKYLIPKSVKSLKKHGIEVRSIYDHMDEIKLFEEIIKLIDSNKFAMASDTLRYSITYNEGGLYADINYKFIQKVDQYCSRFNMFSADHQNNFFCVNKEHIVIKETLNKIESTFKNNPEHLMDLNLEMPIELTYAPYVSAMMKHSNEEGNFDFYYDYYEAHGIKDNGPIGQDNAGLTSHTWI